MANLRTCQWHTAGCKGNVFVQKYCRTLEMAAGQGWSETLVFVSSGAQCDFDCPRAFYGAVKRGHLWRSTGVKDTHHDDSSYSAAG